MSIERSYKNRALWTPEINLQRQGQFVKDMEVAMEKMKEIAGNDVLGRMPAVLGSYKKTHGCGDERYIIVAYNLSRKDGESTGFKKLAQAGALQWSIEAQVLKYSDLFDEKTIEVARDRLSRYHYGG